MDLTPLIDNIVATGANYISTEEGQGYRIIVFDAIDYANYKSCVSLAEAFKITNSLEFISLSYASKICKIEFAV